MPSQLIVYRTGPWALTQSKYIFSDWFEFADYVKQENLAGRSFTIHHWEYIPNG